MLRLVSDTFILLSERYEKYLAHFVFYIKTTNNKNMSSRVQIVNYEKNLQC